MVGSQPKENRRYLMVGLFMLQFSACSYGGGVTSESVEKECVLPTDQSGTLSGQWTVTPIPIAFHTESEFSAEEMEAILSAADTWNDFFTLSLGITIFDYGSASSPNTTSAALSANLCATGIVTNEQFSGQVVIYKKSTWTYSEDVIAITNYCPYPADPIPIIYNAAMELNYQYFFVEGTQTPDLQTIVTHELGHLLGVDHSCEAGGKTGVPDCTSSSLPTAYAEAIMYPKFFFDSAGMGEKRTKLNKNDQGRANCLYQSSE